MSERFEKLTAGLNEIREAVIQYLIPIQSNRFGNNPPALSVLAGGLYGELMILHHDDRDTLMIPVKDIGNVSEDSLRLIRLLEESFPGMSPYMVKRNAVTVLVGLTVTNNDVPAYASNVNITELNTLWDSLLTKEGTYPALQTHKMSVEELGTLFTAQLKAYSRLKLAAFRSGLRLSPVFVKLFRQWLGLREFMGRINEPMSDKLYPISTFAELYGYYSHGDVKPSALPDLIKQWPDSLYFFNGVEDDYTNLALLWSMYGPRAPFPLVKGDAVMAGLLQSWQQHFGPDDPKLLAANVPEDPEMFVKFLYEHGALVLPGKLSLIHI